MAHRAPVPHFNNGTKMKTLLGLAVAATFVVAPHAAAQRCDYGPNSTSSFAKAPQSQQVEARPTPPPGHGSIGFRYEWRDALIQRETRPSTFPLVSCVIVGSPAERAGLRPGDIIVAVNGRDPRLRGSFAERQVGARWVVRIQRAGEERDVSFVIAAPAESPG